MLMNNEEQYEEKITILSKILTNPNLNNNILYLLMQNYPNLYNDIPKEIKINIILNNNINVKLIEKLKKGLEFINLIDLFFKKIDINILSKNKVLINKNFINFYIKYKMNKSIDFDIRAVIYIVKNYQLSKEENDYIYKNINRIYPLKNHTENQTELFNLKNLNIELYNLKKENVFYILFLGQTKINEELKQKITNYYYYLIKRIINNSIINNDTAMLIKFLNFYKYLDEETITNKSVTKYLSKLLENNEDYLIKKIIIKKIEVLFVNFLYINKEYQNNNDLEYFMELNIDNIEYKYEISFEDYLNILESFIYDDNIEKTISVFKIILDLIKIGKPYDKDMLKNVLLNPFFYDNRELIKIDFRKIFIYMFNTVDFVLDEDDEDENRLILNLKYLYESIYYKNININNLKYIIKNKNNKELINFLIYNDLVESFISSEEIKRYNFEYIKEIIIKYVDELNTDVSYSKYDKDVLRKKLLGKMLSNQYFDKNYHFKMYVYYSNDEYLKKCLLNNSELSIIVIFKSSSNINDLKYIVNSSSLY